MKVEKSGKKWIVSGPGDGWVLKKKYPRKWKAELALRVWKEGGRVSDYWAASREEQSKRSSIAQTNAEQAARRRLESARRKYPDEAVIDEDQSIRVQRQPGERRIIEVRFSELSGLHMSQVSGGVRLTSLHYYLYARMWCTSIPENADFPHSCQHGPPPHEILVVIGRKDNEEIYEKLLSRAWF